MHKPESVLVNETHKPLWDLKYKRRSYLRQKTRLNNSQNRSDFVVPADHRVNLKECETKDKYPDLARDLKTLWNMKMTMIPIVISALGTVPKLLIMGQEDL